MHRPIPFTPNTEELSPGYQYRAVYAPFVWVAIMVIRMGLRAGIFSPDFLMPSRPEIEPNLMHRNRQLRRARESCLRRARRHLLKGKKIKPENYTPRAYAHYAYLDRMDKAITPAQFREHYIRDNNISRVQVYGMDSAHEITGFAQDLCAALSGLLSNFVGQLGFASLNLAAPADPAPP